MSKAQGIAQSANQGNFKNRIINGDMRIDQRNNGSSVSNPGNNIYTVDRWLINTTFTGSIGRNLNSITPPEGFTNYLGVVSSSSNTETNYGFRHYVEGFNVADLEWGTANAKPVTLSFWVRSSLTGTFGGAVTNYNQDRSYPFGYTITAANTWEKKTFIIAGDTTGTWDKTNSGGLHLYISYGCATARQGTAGSWAGADFRSVTGQVNVMGTNGATFYITGVQLEKGSTATSFDYRPYGTELALCQRYFETNAPAGTAPSNSVGYNARQVMTAYQTGSGALAIRFAVSKRASTTVTLYGGSILGGSTWAAYVASNWLAGSSMSVGNASADGFEVEYVRAGTFSVAGSYISQGGWAANAEL